mmetsp:Transcript_114973/g.330218  ORF Transcript_114973/g.330218 Transcript_114973/m.330218 type:complete len:309 (-) Transcript_114973:191-1117(-)
MLPPHAAVFLANTVSTSVMCERSMRMLSHDMMHSKIIATMGSTFHDHSRWKVDATMSTKKKSAEMAETMTPCHAMLLRNRHAAKERSMKWRIYTPKPAHATASVNACARWSWISWLVYHCSHRCSFESALYNNPAQLSSIASPIVTASNCSRRLCRRRSSSTVQSSGSASLPSQSVARAAAACSLANCAANTNDENKWDKACKPTHHNETAQCCTAVDNAEPARQELARRSMPDAAITAKAKRWLLMLRGLPAGDGSSSDHLPMELSSRKAALDMRTTGKPCERGCSIASSTAGAVGTAAKESTRPQP